MITEVLLNITDFFWIGHLGPAAQNAITASMIVVWTAHSVMSLITIGLTALVARAVGSRVIDSARSLLWQGVYLAIGVGVGAALAGYLLAPAIMRFMSVDQPTFDYAVPYLRIFFLSGVFFALIEGGYAALRASGNTRHPAVIAVIIVVVNMILDPLLIFGIGPLPRLEVAGAALATALAIFVGAIAVAVSLARGGLGYAIGRAVRIRWQQIGEIVRISFPITVLQLSFVAVYWFLIRIVQEFGTSAGAAMGIGNRMESISYLLATGIGMAAATIVGQNLGAGKPDRAARGAWVATGLGVGVTVIISVVFLAVPESLARVFSADPEVVNIAVDYLVILGLSQMTMAIEIILGEAFSGSGDTVPPAAVTVPGSILRIPLAYWLCFDMELGINGVWWSLTITTGLKAIVLAIWFRANRWQRFAVKPVGGSGD